ncbi:ABC transporter ATP-binding protein [Salimicrobium flavidum]|uniref:Energy-coupling factor transport system ATP-binding protein n=1 Tax=Salimicrobium flavidum TaxID=570947 RepID=A0A1N7IS31_9BACI|nr:ABC transporter ATP-binding protein [Salimicrobium flavidum]SIS39892.1 energy-coupling factor transport system ATP-binding protein [Salimicrobium flavidum]
MIDVKNLTLEYEEMENPVLRNVSFTIDEKESVLLLGASGSGKSTLSRCLTGLYPRELDGSMEGEVRVAGKKVDGASPGAISRHVGIVFQDPETQFCMLTAEDEVAFGLENLGTAPELMEGKVDTALEEVGLLPKKGRTITSLSGGEKQKLALACILAMRPPVIILDEPTANLDPVATDDFVALLERLKLEKDVTLFVIEHDLDPWLSITDRVLMLDREGQLFYDGPLREGIDRYAPILHEEGIAVPQTVKLAVEEGAATPPLPLTARELAGRLPVLPEVREKEDGERALLQTEKVNFKSILHAIDITLPEGSFTAVTGPNGSGKTTLCRVLAGIESPTSGRMLHSFPKKEWFKRVGYVFQNPEHQFLTDSVWAEVAYSGADEERVRHLLEWCGLWERRNLHPFTLSQGEKRRLSVATMLVEDQDLLFLDEPTFGQDARSTRRVMDLLDEKHRSGTTIVMITHDMELVEQYATRVVAMKDGEIGFDGRADELWKRDLDAFQLKRPLKVRLKEMQEGGVRVPQ